ncbi:MAG: hypothetical protein N2111_01760 [Candidatus Sumerlaeaceae bacterium]|nr:hypothetical protein [Candidatus Sumerlaeaceae bacterium]
MRTLAAVPALVAILMSAAPAAMAQRGSVVTFSRADLARLAGGVCGEMPRDPSKITARRNAAGNLVYITLPGRKEAILMPDTQQCNDVSTEVIDLWRAESGEAVAQLTLDEGKPLLLAGESEIRGTRFDIERGGQYLLVSHKNRSTISALAKPYRSLIELDLDGQRLFVRKRNLLVVGDNTKTGQLEARVIRPQAEGMVEDPPIVIEGMRAGVRVLDYSEASDDLLLGGVDATGQTAFVVYNLGSGRAAALPPDKPGDELGLFIANGRLRARLGGGEAPVAPGGEPRRRGPFGF